MEYHGVWVRGEVLVGTGSLEVEGVEEGALGDRVDVLGVDGADVEGALFHGDLGVRGGELGVVAGG